MLAWFALYLFGLIVLITAFVIPLRRIKKNPERALRIAKRLGIKLSEW